MMDVPGILRDPARLGAVERTALLDSPTEEVFDRLTRLACTIFHAPISLVSVVAKDRQFFKSSIGLPEPWATQRQTPLSYSFCQYAVASGKPLVIPNACEHALVRGNRAIPELGVEAYAGVPLVTSEGQAIGAFCVIDHRPRTWTEEELAILKSLADSVMTEIELRARMTEAERERRDKLALLESTDEGIYGLDRAGQCTFINHSGATMLGYRPDELLGKNMHRVVHYRHPDGSLYPEEQCPIVQAFQGNQGVRIDHEVLWRRDGTAFPAEYSSYPVHDGQVITGAVVTFRDITERKRLDEERQRFLSTLSHDLRNPLGTILNLVYLLSRRAARAGGPQAGRMMEGLENIRTAARRMTAIIDELLDINRLRAGQPLEIERQATDLVALVRQEAARQQQAMDRRIGVKTAVPELVGTWDGARLQRVLGNLLGNAVKYSPDGGEITVTVAAEPGAAGSAGWAVVRVQDQGMGIPAADLPHVFEQYHRGANVVGRIAGTGLGLAGSRQIIEQHGGTIDVASIEGVGTTVTLRLPV